MAASSINEGSGGGPGFQSALAADLAPDFASDRLNLRSLLSFLRRRLLMIATIIGICFMLALIVTQRAPRLYTADAEVVVSAKADQVTPTTTTGDAAERPVSEQLETELQLIQSYDVAGKVFDRLELQKDGTFMKAVDAASGGSRLRRWLGVDTPVASQNDNDRRGDAINQMLVSLTAKRVGSSYALRISYTDPDPVRATRIANGFARVYAQHQIDTQSDETKNAIGLLQSRMEQLRAQAQADFGAVQRYRIRNTLQSKSGTSLTEQEISAYNQQVAVARSEAVRDAAQLAAARASARTGQLGDGGATTSAVVNALRSQRAAVSARVVDLSQRYLPSHPDLISARQQLADIDAQITNEVARAIKTLSATAQASRARLSSLEGSLGGAAGKLDKNNQALIGLDDLERKAESSQALYESYLNRFKETVAGLGAEQPTARILSLATVPKLPSSPNLGLNLLLGTLIGVVAGVASAIAAEGAYAGLTTREDVERRLTVRHLGSVPLLESVDHRADTPLETIVRFPGGAFTESMRSALTAIRQSGTSRNQVIAVSSSLPGEGKTTIAACLAYTASLGHERVAIVDCDVVRRHLSEMFGEDASQPGLRELFAGTTTIGAFKTNDRLAGATLFAITRPFEPGARLLEQGRLHRLVTQLRDSFDLIILDCAPVLPIAETREIIGLADNVIIVTLWRATTDRIVRAALKMLQARTWGDLGIVLNRVDMRKRFRFGDGDPEMFSAKAKNYYNEA